MYRICRISRDLKKKCKCSIVSFSLACMDGAGEIAFLPFNLSQAFSVWTGCHKQCNMQTCWLTLTTVQTDFPPLAYQRMPFVVKVMIRGVHKSETALPDSKNRMLRSTVSLWRRGFVAMTIVMLLQWQRC